MESGKYCYPGTDVLINKYNIKDRDLLDELEVQKVSVKLLGLSLDFNRVPPTCDAEHLCSLNKYLFSDLYPWAGQFRTENLYKAERVLSGGTAPYCDYREIPQALDKLFHDYNTSTWENTLNPIHAAVDFFTDLWVIHPFREGNTRTCTTFLWQYLKVHNIEFNVDLLSRYPLYVRDSLVMASYGERSYLTKILADAFDKQGLLVVDDELTSANQKYEIAKEEYTQFKEKYLSKDSSPQKPHLKDE